MDLGERNVALGKRTRGGESGRWSQSRRARHVRTQSGNVAKAWRLLACTNRAPTHIHNIEKKKLEDRALAQETVLLLLVRVGSEFHYVFIFCETYFDMWKKYTRLQVQVKGLQ